MFGTSLKVSSGNCQRVIRYQLIEVTYCLQPGSVNDLVVNDKLMALIADDQDTNAAAAIVEGLDQAVEKIALVEHWKPLLDIASLGHGNNTAIVTDVKNTILLEHRTEHVLDDDRW